MLYDIFSGVIIILAIAGTFKMVKLAMKHPKARLPFLIVAGFCLYTAGFYVWILAYTPTIGLTTAAGGRALVAFLMAGVIMLGNLMDK
jgi:hypothetical protein